MKIKKLALGFMIACFMMACQMGQKENELHVNIGTARIATDEAFKQIILAQTEAYKAHYPKTKFNLVCTPEQKAVGLMLKDSADIAVTSRELTAQEQKYFTSRGIPYTPAKMAVDAVVLITNKASGISEISVQQVGQILKGQNTSQQLIFDHGNSSNLNFLLSHFGLMKVDGKNVMSANGSEAVFSYIKTHKQAIGVVGLNWISDTDDRASKSRKESVTVLKVSRDGQAAVFPESDNLVNLSYPFSKFIYLHTTQHRWGVAKGLIRFSCSQVGQLVVEKMGLQPYYLIPKEYKMSDTPEINVVE